MSETERVNLGFSRMAVGLVRRTQEGGHACPRVCFIVTLCATNKSFLIQRCFKIIILHDTLDW